MIHRKEEISDRPSHAASTSLRLYPSGAGALSRMLSAIAQARREVRLEVYALAPDSTGSQFITALGEAARRGVATYVVIDAWGTRGNARRVRSRLRSAGCHVRIYNPLLAGLFGPLRRNHRKLLLVDDRVAFLGGANFNDACLGVNCWEDL